MPIFPLLGVIRFRFFHVVENVGDVIVFFEFLDQFLDRCALFVGHLFRVERNAFEFTADQFVVVILDVFLDFEMCIRDSSENICLRTRI